MSKWQIISITWFFATLDLDPKTFRWVFFPYNKRYTFSYLKDKWNLKEYERAVIFRLGRLLSGGARGPGVFFIIPCVDIYEKIDMRTATYEIPPQEILTKDSVTVFVNAIMYYKVRKYGRWWRFKYALHVSSINVNNLSIPTYNLITNSIHHKPPRWRTPPARWPTWTITAGRCMLFPHYCKWIVSQIVPQVVLSHKLSHRLSISLQTSNYPKN